MDNDELLHIEQVSELTKIPVASLRYMRGRHMGPPCFKLARRLVYLKTDVESWIREKYAEAMPAAERVSR